MHRAAFPWREPCACKKITCPRGRRPAGAQSGDGRRKRKWRREWDSNPRPFRVTGFQDQLLKPLGHLSMEPNWSDARIRIPQLTVLVNDNWRILRKNGRFSQGGRSRGAQSLKNRPQRLREGGLFRHAVSAALVTEGKTPVGQNKAQSCCP